MTTTDAGAGGRLIAVPRADLEQIETLLGRHVHPKPDVGDGHPWAVLTRLRALLAAPPKPGDADGLAALSVAIARNHFLTCTGGDGRGSVEMQFGTLKDAQAAHEAIVRAAHGVSRRLTPAPQAAAAAGEAGSGWRLVPEAATSEMALAGWIDKEDVCPSEIWAAMLAAAPNPPAADRREAVARAIYEARPDRYAYFPNTGQARPWSLVTEAEREVFRKIACQVILSAQDASGGDGLTQAAGDASGDGWRDDPAADERWNAGLDFGLDQLCAWLGVDPGNVSWDAATETLDGDVQAVVGNILRIKFGDDFDFKAVGPINAPPSDRALPSGTEERS